MIYIYLFGSIVFISISFLPYFINYHSKYFGDFYYFQNPNILRDSLFYFYGDTFGDAFKVIYSYDHIFIEDKIIYFTNLYNGNPFLNPIPNTELNYNVHTLPFPTVVFHLFAFIINLFEFPHPYFVIVWYLLYLALVVKNFILIRKTYIKYSNIYIILSLFSYPVLFLVQRGNFLAGYAFQLIILTYVSFFYEKKFNLKTMIFLTLSLSIRPNYFFLIPVFFINKPVQIKIKSLFKILLIFLTSNFIFIKIANLMYEDYSFSNMMVGFRYVRDFHLLTGDGFDSSVFRVVQRLFNPSNLLFTYNTIFLIGFFIVVYLIFDQKIEAKLKVFLYTFSSLVFSFPIADYHLPVLIFIILFNGFEDEKPKLDNFLFLLVLIVLFPIPHLFLWTFPSYSNMLNVAIYFYVLFISLKKNRYKNLLN